MDNYATRIEKGLKKPKPSEIEKDLNNLWGGMYRGIIVKKDGNKFSSKYDYGPQLEIDESPIAEMKDKLKRKNIYTYYLSYKSGSRN